MLPLLNGVCYDNSGIGGENYRWLSFYFLSPRVFKHAVPHVCNLLEVCALTRLCACRRAPEERGFMGLCVCTMWFVVLQHLFTTAWISTRLQWDSSSLE